MDLPLKTIRASYIIVWPSFRENTTGSKILAIDLSHLLSPETGSLAWADVWGAKYF